MSQARGWAEKDYETVAGFFAEDVRYIDPVRCRLEFFRNDEGTSRASSWHNVAFDEEPQRGAGRGYKIGPLVHKHGLIPDARKRDLWP